MRVHPIIKGHHLTWGLWEINPTWSGGISVALRSVYLPLATVLCLRGVIHTSAARVCSDVTHLLHQTTAVYSQVAYADTDGDVIVNVDGASVYAAAISVIPPTVD